MMGHRQVEQAALFYEFSLERHIPADHWLRSIDRFIELGGLRRELAPFYSSMGRPSIDPRADDPNLMKEIGRLGVSSQARSISTQRREIHEACSCLSQSPRLRLSF